MALRRLSLPIIFAALLLFSQAFARELEEKPAADKRDADLNVGDHLPYFRRPCKYRCHSGCCSEEEFAVFSQTQMDGFNDNKQYGYGHGGYGPGYGHGGYGPGYGRGGYGGYCRFRCGYRCCSAEEYAEFVQAGN